MNHYIGTKLVVAQKMNKEEYCKLRGWAVPENEDPNEAGYLVEYSGSPNQNHPDYKNYISWSPAVVFEGAYEPLDKLSFSHALDLLKTQPGLKIARAGWNGKGMYLFLIGTDAREVGTGGWTYTNGWNDNMELLPFIAMKTADDKVVPWLASQTDILANDWCVL